MTIHATPTLKVERALMDQFQEVLTRMEQELTVDRLELSLRIAELPLSIRGFGPVKLARIAEYHALLRDLLENWDRSTSKAAQ